MWRVERGSSWSISGDQWGISVLCTVGYNLILNINYSLIFNINGDMNQEKDMLGGAGGERGELSSEEVSRQYEVELSNFTLHLSTELQL